MVFTAASETASRERHLREGARLMAREHRPNEKERA